MSAQTIQERPGAPRGGRAQAEPGATSEQGGLPPARRLLRIVRPERGDVVSIVLYAVVVGLLTLATPIAVQQLVNTVAFGGLVQPVIVLALLLLTGLGFAALLSTFQAYLSELIQRRVFVRACVDVADRLPRAAVDAFGHRHGPELVNRFFDLVTLQKSGATLLLDGTTVVLQTAAGLLILSFYHPVMLGFSFVLVGAIAFVVLGLGRSATPTAIEESSAKYELAGWLEELARHPATFRSVSGRSYALARADGLASSWVRARREHYRIVLRQIAASAGLQAFVSTLVLGIGGALVVAGQLTLGQLVASEIIVAAVVAAFARLGKQLETYYDLLAAVDKVGVLLDLPLERETGEPLEAAPTPASVEAHGVTSGYDGSPVLDRVSLRVEPGERVALVGPEASGKSTLLDLLCGFRPPSEGYVTIDGRDLRDVQLESLRQQVLCIREPEIFAGSIAENLRVGRPDASAEDLDDALAKVGLLDGVRSLPDGLETALATDGGPLSRGQIIRLMLARAFVARPRLLVLDGAVAHLDAAARKLVIDGLFDPAAPWTLLVVADQDDLIERCDRRIDMAALYAAAAGRTAS